MDIRQLEAFVYTVKYQSFSLAAQKLYISQPTVSAHIRSLEEEFHTQLLKRTTKSLSLTPAGTKLYSYATEILTAGTGAEAPASLRELDKLAVQRDETAASDRRILRSVPLFSAGTFKRLSRSSS